MRRVLVLLACLAVPGAGAPAALADGCGIPESAPLWVDFAGHNAPVPAKPGMILAVSSGTDIPAAMRAHGAATIFFDLNFNNRIGTTTKPADPATIADKAKKEFDYAVSVTGCQTPIIAENELFGAQTPTPGRTRTRSTAQTRSRSCRTSPGSALARAHDREPAVHRRRRGRVVAPGRQGRDPDPPGLLHLAELERPLRAGPVRASRAMRQGLRGLVSHFSTIGIPSNRIALELQFQAAPALGARAGLQPASSWFEIVKLEALAARQVAQEFKLEGIWSWGWATYSAAGADPDKPFAACVWLWVRDSQLCNAPKYVQPAFDSSLTEGQLLLPANARCVLPNKQVIDRDSVGRLTTVTGDDGFAASALLERAVLRAEEPISDESVRSAQRAVVDASFGGSRARYLAALSQVKLTPADATAIITDRLARDVVESRFRPQPPPAAEVTDFLTTYAAQSARLVRTTRPAPWLDGKSTGWVVSTLGPPTVFQVAEHGEHRHPRRPVPGDAARPGGPARAALARRRAGRSETGSRQVRPRERVRRLARDGGADAARGRALPRRQHADRRADRPRGRAYSGRQGPGRDGEVRPRC